MPGCPIRKSADHIACADTRGLSQLVTSFIASGSLGIPRVPLSTFFIDMYPFCKVHARRYPPILLKYNGKPLSYFCIISFPICQRTYLRNQKPSEEGAGTMSLFLVLSILHPEQVDRPGANRSISMLISSILITIMMCATGTDPDAPERRYSSRTFRYGYLVTT